MNHKVKIGEDTYEINLETAIKQGLIKKVPTTLKSGQIFRLGTLLYLLATVDQYLVCFIGLHSGNRWGKPVRIEEPWDITPKEWAQLVGANNFEYIGEASDLREILNKFNPDTPYPYSPNDPDDES